MTKERADEVYAASQTSGRIDPDSAIHGLLTPQEQSEVSEQWKKMSGASCWLDAFFMFMSWDKLPPYMKLRYKRDDIV